MAVVRLDIPQIRFALSSKSTKAPVPATTKPNDRDANKSNILNFIATRTRSSTSPVKSPTKSTTRRSESIGKENVEQQQQSPKICSMCDNSYNSGNVLEPEITPPFAPSNNNNQKEQIQQNWKEEMFRVLCAHFNAMELYDNLIASEELIVALDAFNLCANCMEVTEKLVQLDQKINELLQELNTAAIQIRDVMAASKSVQQNVIYSSDEVTPGFAYIRNFKLLAVQPQIEYVESVENQEGLSTELWKDSAEPERPDESNEMDFACIETVSSLGVETPMSEENPIVNDPSNDTEMQIDNNENLDENNEDELIYDDNEEGDGNYSDCNSPIPPAFSPISVTEEDLVFVYHLNENNQEFQEPEPTNNEEVTHKKPDVKKPRRGKPKSPKPKRLKLNKAMKLIEKNKKTSIQKIRNKLPKVDREGFTTMMNMGIPFQRLEIPLIRVPETLERKRKPDVEVDKLKSPKLVEIEVEQSSGRPKRKGAKTDYKDLFADDDDTSQPIQTNDPDFRLGATDKEEATSIGIGKSDSMKSQSTGVTGVEDEEMDTSNSSLKPDKSEDAFIQNFSTVELSSNKRSDDEVLKAAEIISESLQLQQPEEVNIFTIKSKSPCPKEVSQTSDVVKVLHPKFVCEQCGKIKKSKSGLNHHVKNRHFEAVLPPVENEVEEEIKLTTIGEEQAKSTIIETELINKPTTIEVEEQTATTIEVEELNSGNPEENVIIQLGKQKFLCNVCQKDFKYLLGAKLHLKAVHNQDHPQVRKVLKNIARTNKVQKRNVMKKLKNMKKKFGNAFGKDSGSSNSRINKMRKKKIESPMKNVPEQFEQKINGNFTVELKVPSPVKNVPKYKQKTDDFTEKLETPLKNVLGQCKDKIENFKDELKVQSKEPEESKFKCEKCPISFSSAIDLTEHTRQIHDKNLRHKCDICNKRFFQVRDYIAHLQTHSDVANAYKCDLFGCDESFSTLQLMQDHKIFSHLPTFKCTKCQRFFSAEKYLKEHIKAKHDKPAIEPENASIVLATSTSNAPAPVIPAALLPLPPNLKSRPSPSPGHRVMNSTSFSPTTFKYTKCEKNCTDEKYLNEHVISKHDKPAIEPEKAANAPVKILDLESKPSQSSPPDMVNNIHLKVISHADVTTFKCTKCQRCFKTEKYLKAHIKSKHDKPAAIEPEKPSTVLNNSNAPVVPAALPHLESRPSQAPSSSVMNKISFPLPPPPRLIPRPHRRSPSKINNRPPDLIREDEIMQSATNTAETARAEVQENSADIDPSSPPLLIPFYEN